MKRYLWRSVAFNLILINVLSVGSLYATQTESTAAEEESSIKNNQSLEQTENSNEVSENIDSNNVNSDSVEMVSDTIDDQQPREHIAVTYLCEYSTKVRKVQIKYLQYPEKVPCRVLYHKMDEEPVKVLWRYNHQEGYCESHAANFVEKQRGWGWSCSEEND